MAHQIALSVEDALGFCGRVQRMLHAIGGIACRTEALAHEAIVITSTANALVAFRTFVVVGGRIVCIVTSGFEMLAFSIRDHSFLSFWENQIRRLGWKIGELY